MVLVSAGYPPNTRKNRLGGAPGGGHSRDCGERRKCYTRLALISGLHWELPL